MHEACLQECGDEENTNSCNDSLAVASSDVQAHALAGTWQGDADRLTTWYSGWYNGLAKKHFFNIARSKELEHEVIVYCKANPQIRIIEALDVMFKHERLRSGFK
jgi:hypothetical protein